MIVVSNTSQLTNLGAIHRLGLLPALYGKVHIPQAVLEEFHADRKLWPGVREVAASDWIIKHQVKNQPLLQQLGPGDSEALTVAVQLTAGMILLDEKDGRAADLRRVCLLLEQSHEASCVEIAGELDKRNSSSGQTNCLLRN